LIPPCLLTGSAAVFFDPSIALNLPVPNRDQEQAPYLARKFGDLILMKSVRPDNTDPIPLRNTPHNMGTIMIRFVGMLVAIVVVLALLWSR
jgi:hypothetical protein